MEIAPKERKPLIHRTFLLLGATGVGKSRWIADYFKTPLRAIMNTSPDDAFFYETRTLRRENAQYRMRIHAKESKNIFVGPDDGEDGTAFTIREIEKTIDMGAFDWNCHLGWKHDTRIHVVVFLKRADKPQWTKQELRLLLAIHKKVNVFLDIMPQKDMPEEHRLLAGHEASLALLEKGVQFFLPSQLSLDLFSRNTNCITEDRRPSMERIRQLALVYQAGDPEDEHLSDVEIEEKMMAGLEKFTEEGTKVLRQENRFFKTFAGSRTELFDGLQH